MNRADRRKAARENRLPDIEHLGHMYACPDCHADRHLSEVAPGMYRLVVAHDETCPTYRSLKETT